MTACGSASPRATHARWRSTGSRASRRSACMRSVAPVTRIRTWSWRAGCPEGEAIRHTEVAVIARHWRGLARAYRAADYLQHLRTETFPALQRLPGFVDA